MFSFGDALVIGMMLWVIVWALKRCWPDIYGSELTKHLRLNNRERERKAYEQRQHERERDSKVPHGYRPPHLDADDPAGMVTALKRADAEYYGEQVPKAGKVFVREEVVPEASARVDRKSSIGRAHVVEDGAFAGGLKDKEVTYDKENRLPGE